MEKKIRRSGLEKVSVKPKEAALLETEEKNNSAKYFWWRYLAIAKCASPNRKNIKNYVPQNIVFGQGI